MKATAEMTELQTRIDLNADTIKTIQERMRRVSEFNARTEGGNQAKSELQTQLGNEVKHHEDTIMELTGLLEVATVRHLASEEYTED